MEFASELFLIDTHKYNQKHVLDLINILWPPGKEPWYLQVEG